MIRVRFAPSPTGHLHLGNVRTALFNFLFARAQGGRFVLRSEDTDAERSREEFFRSQIEDLLWLGIQPDEGPECGGDAGPYRQSQRTELYREAIEKLIREEKAYYCYVTPEELEEARQQARDEKRSVHFDNRGRTFSKEEIERRKAQGIRPTVRFKIDAPELVLQDLIRGEVKFNLDDMVGDFVIQRADGNPTFHLAVCVDDALMKITHVIRGEDHLSNTPKHLLLFRGLGIEPPVFGHLSLVHGPGGEPLSKRMESISMREFRRRGYLPEALANYIALLGWSPGDDREILAWEELQKIFDLAKVSRSSSNFDPEKLDWVNGSHIRALAPEDFARRSLAYLKGQSALAFDEEAVLKALPVFQEHVERFEQLEERLKVLQEDFPYENREWILEPEAKQIFEAAIQVLETRAAAGAETVGYDEFMDALKAGVSIKGKKLFMPLRVALTGQEHGPELKKIFPALSVTCLKGRFERAGKES